MRLATSRGKPACHHAHGNKTDSIHPAIPMRSAARDSTTEKNCAHTKTRKVQNTIEHQGSTKKHQNECARNRLTHELPFIAACSHFTRKSTRFRASTNPMQHSCSHYNALVLLCAVIKPHTTLHDVLLCAVQSHATLHDVLLCAVKSHRLSWCIVMWCKVTWIKVIRNLENCFPTSFDNLVKNWYNIIW